MGGSGSGRWDGHRKRRTVESCCCLEVIAGGAVSGTMPGGHWEGSFEKRNDLTFLVLRGEKDGWKAEERIVVLFWTPRFGGKSLWLLCPACGRKCRKIYAPPGMAKYRCRRCWDLAYTSSQEAHAWDRGACIGMLCMATGLTPREIGKSMRADFKAQRAGQNGR
jgi:hypothetical protein